MVKKQAKTGRTCGECIHESACQTWSANGYIHNTKANCANYETVKSSNAYLIGFMEGKKHIVHGHWEQVDETKCRCSKCDIIALIGLYPHGDKNFCPNCGAKMDEEEEND